jgi:hypothetical protein
VGVVERGHRVCEVWVAALQAGGRLAGAECHVATLRAAGKAPGAEGTEYADDECGHADGREHGDQQGCDDVHGHLRLRSAELTSIV